MAMENYSLSDLATVTNAANDGWNGGGFWMIILLFLFFCGNGGWNNRGNAFTQTDALMNTNFDNLDRNIQSIANRQYEQANALTKGLCDLGYTEAQQAFNTQQVLGGQISGLREKIDAYGNAIQTAVHNEAETTRALINAQENQRLRDELGIARAQINADRVGQNVLGQLGRFYPNPPCYQGCGCGNAL